MKETARHPYPAAYDAVVVGSGLAGGWAAKELTEAGLHVLVVEAGPFIDPIKLELSQEYSVQERAKLASRQPIQSKHPSYWLDNPKLFVDDLENPYSTDGHPFIWIRGRQVGGRSLTWLGICLRFSDFEFLGPEREGFGQNWPIRYGELAPFYDRVETFLQVQGSKDGIPQLPDGPFAAPPTLTHDELRFRRLIALKWPDRPLIQSRGLQLLTSHTQQSNNAWSQRSNLGNTIPAALRTGRLTLMPNTIVSHLRVDENNGTISALFCIDRLSKQGFEIPVKLCILCASTLESVRIMLNSKSSKHPGGVGNSSGLLGRFLFDHRALSFGGRIINPQTSVKPAQLGGAHGVLVPRFRNLPGDHRGYKGGFGMWGFMHRQFDWIPSRPSQWMLTSMLEVLPRPSNRIDIDQHAVDAWGIKIAKIYFQYGDNEEGMTRDARTCMLEMLEAAGVAPQYEAVTIPGQYVHELGGARMGNDPTSSVLNRFNQCWDATNLFVVDGSCFVSAGWQNPSLTIMALAARACQYIATKRSDYAING